MSKCRALTEGYDGLCLRGPGDLFDMDPDQQYGRWFEYVDPADAERAEIAYQKRRMTKVEHQVHADLTRQIHADAEARLRDQALRNVASQLGKVVASEAEEEDV